MKRFRPWLLPILCAGALWLIFFAMAKYPAVREASSDPVSRIEGLSLSIEKPRFSPIKGYTIRYRIEISTDEIYQTADPFERLEKFENGCWHRLECQKEPVFSSPFDISGDNAAFDGSFVQKYDGYGTRLHPGTYRLTLGLTDAAGGSHCLAAEFEIS